MKNLIDTIKNIWRIEELRNRILITLGLLLVYRIGSFIVLPGVDSARMADASSGGGGIVEILQKAEVDPDTVVEEWTDDEQARIRQYINEHVKVEGA
ncbi:MAG: hypothetical protein ACK6A5_14070, partial [Flavobacteriales bacterium]